VIYSDSGGSVGALLLTGSETTLATGDANTTKSLPLGSSYTFTKNTIYWVGAIYNNSFSWRASAGSTQWKANTYTSGAPSSPTGFSNSGNQIYVRLVTTVSGGILGLWDTDADASFPYNCVADETDVAQFTMPGTGYGTPASLFLRFANSVTAGDKFKAVIYSDTGGAPGSLLATSAEYTVVSGDAGKQAELAFTSPPNLNGGTVYWVGVICSGGTDLLNTNLGARYKGSTTYASGPVSSLTSTTSTVAGPGLYLKYN